MKTNSSAIIFETTERFRFLYGRWKQIDVEEQPEEDTGSDSSMVDENWEAPGVGAFFYLFRFLYGRWKLKGMNIRYIALTSSDSSMVDENTVCKNLLLSHIKVQIPLWSMKTGKRMTNSTPVGQFRFLYGRWKLLCAHDLLSLYRVQIPLWSMKTWSPYRTYLCRSFVQIPLWSMKTIARRPA